MDRVLIGRNYIDQPAWKRYLGIPLIYAPLLTTIPFVITGILLVKFHLKYVGGMDIRPYWSFVPSWVSHRYQYDNQITFDSKNTWFQFQG
ncbi:MAG: hypothetical protein OES29_03965, partial [Desulfuromonadales bacterium]|nr:hypothetical protein [Desulfuromonadales bacterium]